ncbi:MAG: signal peptidase I [Nitrospirota bacterium]
MLWEADPDAAAFDPRMMERDETVWLTVEGRSMSPVLRSGDAVMIRCCTADAVKPGDVITVADPAGLCTHRLIMITHEGGKRLLWTKGDACAHWDDPIDSEALLGKGVAMLRGGRHLSLEKGWRALNFVMLGVSMVLGGLLWVKWTLRV